MMPPNIGLQPTPLALEIVKFITRKKAVPTYQCSTRQRRG
jgi:hypothetical protein